MSSQQQSELFFDAFGNRLSLSEVVREIFSFLEAAPDRQYKVIIGTDSENHSEADFVTAVVAHRVGNGGRYWWSRVRLASFATLRERIYREALFSLEIAQRLIGIMEGHGGVHSFDKLRTVSRVEPFDFEIHVDIGEKGETRVLVQEVVGMIRGSGFEVKIKPESYGATKVADRHV